MPRNWSDACAGDSTQRTTVGGWTRPTSGSRASGCIYIGPWTPAVRRSTSCSRPNAMQQLPSTFWPKRSAEQTIRRRESSTPTSMPLTQPAIVQLKDEGVLEENCQHRPVQYLWCAFSKHGRCEVAREGASDNARIEYPSHG